MDAATAAPGFAAIREQEFCFEAGDIFLNAASYGPLPERCRSTVEDYEWRRQRGQLGEHDFAPTLAAARDAAARLIGARPQEIALTPNTNVGVNLGAALALERARSDPRRGIVVSAGEFPANVYPWLALERHGFDVRIVPTLADGIPDEARLEREISRDDVAAFALSFVQFATGWRADLEVFGDLCRRNHVLFTVDAIQGLGVLPLDVTTLHIDVLATGAQKWLCSPYATGFAWLRPDLVRDHEPILPGWLAFTSSLDLTTLVDYEYQLHDDARRFEVGTLAFQGFAGMTRSIELLLELGVDRIETHVRELLDQIIDHCNRRGIPIGSDLAPDHRSGILCIRPGDPAAIHGRLTQANITCALREGAIRISPHFYNAPWEIDALLAVLR